MTTAHHTIPTLEDYAFDLRKGLRAAAKASLSSLEDLINEVGYGWLDGYMDGVMDTASRYAASCHLLLSSTAIFCARESPGIDRIITNQKD